MRFSTFSILSLFLFLCHVSVAQEKQHTVFGHNDAMLYGRYWSDSKEGKKGKSKKETQPDVYQVCGAYPGLLSTDLGRLEQGFDIYWAGVTFEQVRQSIIRYHHSGGLITISWHAHNPHDGGSWIYNEKTRGTVGWILKRKGWTYSNFMLYLQRIADFLLQLRDKDGNLIPIIFRPWHECNGSWFWWGTKGCTAEEYIALWRMTHDYLTERGLTNLQYAFSPGSWFWSKEDYMQRFPGKEYVDIIGVECYRQKNVSQKAARNLFISHVHRNFDFAKEIADSLGMPYALTEMGKPHNTDPEWWTQALQPALEGYSPLFVNCWSNQWIVPAPDGGVWCTYPGENSAEDFRKFYKMNKSMFLKKLKKK